MHTYNIIRRFARRGLAVLLSAGLALPAAHAVPAYPGLLRVKQPSGREVCLYLRGDERMNWAMTPDGYTLLRDNEGFWTFAQPTPAGEIAASTLRYEGTSHPAQILGIQPRLMPTRTLLPPLQPNLPAPQHAGMQRAKNLQLENSFPTKGKRKLLMLLVNFNDTQTTYSQQDFHNLMNQTGYAGVGSFRDYYLEQSYGQFEVETTVTRWITVNGAKRYYGTEAAESLIREALLMIEDEIDLTEFDNDGDGVLDGLAVIHQGMGQEMTGSSTDIWSHSSEIYGLTIDGITVSRYTIEPEQQSDGSLTNIGVICHEFGHNLGAPDFYDTDYEKSGGSYGGTGVWDLMGSGAWNGEYGNRPGPINMWQKIAMGWVTPTLLSATTQVRNMPAACDEAVAYRINTTVPGEYFILENCQKRGNFNSALPGSGLLIYRANENLIAQRTTLNTLNAFHPQAMYTVCANAGREPSESSFSYGDLTSDAAPFPGSAGVTAFSDATLPSGKSITGRRSYFTLTGIAENAGGIDFDYTALTVPPAPVALKAEASRGDVSLTWQAPEGNAEYPRPTAYTVYRNNQVLGTTTSLSYYDEKPENEGLLEYSVDALYADDNVSPYVADTLIIPVNRVQGFTCTRTDGVNTLRWTLGNRLTRIDLTPTDGAYNQLNIGGVDSLDYVQRFSAEDLLVYKGARITAVNIFPLTLPSTSTYEVRVWETDKNGRNPKIVSSRKAEEFGTSTWSRVALTDPVTIIKGRTYYIGAHLVSSQKGFALMTDAGPYQPGGCLLKFEDEWEEALDPQGNFYVSAELSYAAPKTMTTLSEWDADVTEPMAELQFPVGFRIYRDGVEAGTTGNLLFIDSDAQAGAHEYAISGLFRGGNESDTATFTFDGSETATGIEPTTGEAPALSWADAGTLCLRGAHGTVRVYDAAGRLVQSHAADGTLVLRPGHGVHLITLETPDGRRLTWKACH